MTRGQAIIKIEVLKERIKMNEQQVGAYVKYMDRERVLIKEEMETLMMHLILDETDERKS